MIGGKQDKQKTYYDDSSPIATRDLDPAGPAELPGHRHARPAGLSLRCCDIANWQALIYLKDLLGTPPGTFSAQLHMYPALGCL